MQTKINRSFIYTFGFKTTLFLGSDYINATWLHGHDKLKEFIITQHPTSLVKDDFWRMLWDHNAQTVVLLSPVEEPVCLNYISTCNKSNSICIVV